MAAPDVNPELIRKLSVEGLTVGIVRASWHPEIVDRLVAGAKKFVSDQPGGDEADFQPVIVTVPGCFELALACQTLAEMGGVDAMVALGVLVRGDTIHFDLVAQSAATAIQQVQLATKVPIGLGMLAVENEEQAMVRSDLDGYYNAGYDAMHAALIMQNLTAPNTIEEIKNLLEQIEQEKEKAG